MKKLYQRLILIYLVSALLFIVIFAASLYLRGQNENGHYLYQLLGAVDSNLDDAELEYEKTADRLAEDYMIHARETAYLLARDERTAEETALEALRELMDVGSISLIDPSGVITVSTDEALEGKKEDEGIMEELERGDPEVIRIDEPDFWDRPAYFYVAVPVSGGRFGAVRIDGDLSQPGLTSGAERVKKILRQATTDYDTSILAAGKARGLIIGITENNRQDIEIEDVDEGKDMVAFMDALPKGEPVMLRINGEWQSVVVRERHDMYLAAFTAMDQVAADMLATLVIGLCAVAVISAATVVMIRFFIRKYLFDHFRQLQDGITGVLRGERKIMENESEIPELKPLLETIFRLEREYSDKRTEADRDRLTGLYNRNGFEHIAEGFLMREGAEGALILFDLDNFKLVNDMDGHPAGDRLLQCFAGCLTETFRRDDVAARLGGDEFIILVRSPVNAVVLEEKFRELSRKVHTAFGKYYAKYSVSASAGAVLADGDMRDYRSLYKCADTALYIAKYMGKDRFYINEEKIMCMRRECIGCREDCPRSMIMKEKEAGGGQ